LLNLDPYPASFFGINIFDQNMIHIFSHGSMKDFQASGEASSHQERAFLSSKLDISFSLLLGGHFCFSKSSSGSLFQIQILIRIYWPVARLNPDPHHKRSASSWPGTPIKRKQNFPHIQMGSGAKSYEVGLPDI
jgi:hypothetical protein